MKGISQNTMSFITKMQNSDWLCCAIENKDNADKHIEFQKEINGQTFVLICYADGKPYNEESIKPFL